MDVHVDGRQAEMTSMEEAPKAAGIVYVVDDEMDVRLSLRFQLATLGYVAYLYVAAADFLDAVADLHAGCVLLDIRMRGQDGFQVMAELKRRDVNWPVIVMTGHAEVKIAVSVMKQGAIEFLEKPFEEAQLREALDRGFAALDSALAHQDRTRSNRRRMGSLSPRERDVLQHLLRGEANKVAAHALGLSVRTVEMHRANLMAKLGVRSVAEAASIAASVAP